MPKGGEMFVPQPGNDAFAGIMRKATEIFGYTDPEVKAVAVLLDEGKVRRVTWSRHAQWYCAIQPGEKVAIEDGDIPKAITKLLGPGTHRDPIIANQDMGDNTKRWVLWHPIKGQPNLIGGKEVSATYRPCNVV